ncbi:MAG TPA: nucleotidyl transferase AbiEii/AbiGii toxin family protein [bacterium]
MKISIPKSLNRFAAICLETLKNSPLGKFISLGGAVGLSLYHEFRATKDVDAWWNPEATVRDKQLVIDLLKTTLDEFGNVAIRRFGDVVSLDLQQKGKVVFNFQIANRSALLRPTVESPWVPVTLDSLDDLVASKMSALIERGAPRDFLDIYEISNQKLITISRCWALWQEREIIRGVTDPEQKIGCEALLLHLSRIERSRPLETIADLNERNHANEVRVWFKNEFCKGKFYSH